MSQIGPDKPWWRKCPKERWSHSGAKRFIKRHQSPQVSHFTSKGSDVSGKIRTGPAGHKFVSRAGHLPIGQHHIFGFLALCGFFPGVVLFFPCVPPPVASCIHSHAHLGSIPVMWIPVPWRFVAFISWVHFLCAQFTVNCRKNIY